MNRHLFTPIMVLAFIASAAGQTANDPNEGAQMTRGAGNTTRFPGGNTPDEPTSCNSPPT